MIQLYNIKDYAIIHKKGTTVAQMVAANEVPDRVVASGTVESFECEGWPRKASPNTAEERREVLFKKWDLSGLKCWSEENKDKALNLLAKYHASLH